MGKYLKNIELRSENERQIIKIKRRARIREQVP
jgi:hypothetical protein